MTYERKETLCVKFGDAIAIQLDDECPSSGYLWMVENNGGAEVKRQPVTPDGSIGGSLEAVFNVKAPAPGVYNIEFVHMRPWEDKVHTRVRYMLSVAP